jgi:lipoprotein Spr
MIREFSSTKGKLIILLVTVIQLLITSCSKQLLPEKSFLNIENSTDRKKLNVFMAAGIEKEINTHNTSPDEIIKTAQKYLGVPHCMGGTTTKCMDCSGLLFTVFASHGISLPHNSEEQARYGIIIAGMNELKKGDLLFFIRSYKTNRFITHSGIYIGNNNFIHASSSKGVIITSINDRWWKERFIFGTRVFE